MPSAPNLDIASKEETLMHAISKTLIELVYVATIPESESGRVEEIAKGLPIRNEVKVWNCQDYVIELLGALETQNIIDKNDSKYKGRKGQIQKKMDGFV